ncbi:unnamed protein product [Leuciscus chuanchicus]
MELSSLRQRKDDFICLDSSPTRSMTSQEQSRCGTPSEPQRTSSPTIPREYVDPVKSTAKLMNNEKIGLSGIPLSACVPADSKYRIKFISGLNAPQEPRVGNTAYVLQQRVGQEHHRVSKIIPAVSAKCCIS